MKYPKQKTQDQLQKEVDFFNSTIKIGDFVNVKDDEGQVFQDKVCYPASIMGGHTAMAWLEDTGSYLLDRVLSKV